MPIARPSESETPAVTCWSEPDSTAWTSSSTALRETRATSGTERPTPSMALRISRTATWTASAGPLEPAPFVVERERVVVERVAVESAVMAIYLLDAQP
jgi:hypothetical protein